MANNDFIEKDLGIVTAYGEAVEGGYRGTRADFQALLVRMANSYLTYNDLNDKPSINGVMLQGNKTSTDLNINAGTSDYSSLSNKPSINGVTLQGNKTTSDLGITAQTTLNSATSDGYVRKGGANVLSIWATDANGAPAWRQLVTNSQNATFSIGATTTKTVEIATYEAYSLCSVYVYDSEIVVASAQLVSSEKIKVTLYNYGQAKSNVRIFALILQLV